MRRKKKESFWSKPDGMSIVDVLALSFSAVYLTVVTLGLTRPQYINATEIQSNMNMLMTTILGGYFGDQIVQHWKNGDIERVEAEKPKPQEESDYTKYV